MPRRHYDLDEVLAFAESGKSAPEIIELLGLNVTPRAIQKTVNRYLGPRPVRRPAQHALVGPVRRYMEAQGLDARYCALCCRHTFDLCFIRALAPDLDSCIFVCGRCKRPGDV